MVGRHDEDGIGELGRLLADWNGATGPAVDPSLMSELTDPPRLVWWAGPPQWRLSDALWTPPPGWEPPPGSVLHPDDWEFWRTDPEITAEDHGLPTLLQLETLVEPRDTDEDIPYVWVAPTGWPTPPTGWSPPANWRHDPAWPPVPPAWQFWQRDPELVARRQLDSQRFQADHVLSYASSRWGILTTLNSRERSLRDLTFLRRRALSPGGQQIQLGAVLPSDHPSRIAVEHSFRPAHEHLQNSIQIWHELLLQPEPATAAQRDLLASVEAGVRSAAKVWVRALNELFEQESKLFLSRYKLFLEHLSSTGRYSESLADAVTDTYFAEQQTRFKLRSSDD